MATHILTLSTRGPGLYEVTDQIADWVAQQAVAQGLLTVMIRHTSASLLIQENADPDVQRDLQEWVDRFVPRGTDPSMGWMRHTAEGPDDMPAHIRAAHLPVSLSIPVGGGRMLLGTWQGIYVWEHRDRPHSRSLALHLGP